MLNFDKNYFVAQDFKPSDLNKFKEAAKRELDIAKSSPHPEVKFHFAYMVLLKIGIYYIAKAGYRVKAKPGHHQKVIEFLSKLLKSDDVLVLGDKMRRDRNLDLYDAEGRYSEDDIQEYINFVEELFIKLEGK